jgi:hypothetical protein
MAGASEAQSRGWTTMGDRKRVAIAFHVDEDGVNIIGVFY